jgi:hypothetical protein
MIVVKSREGPGGSLPNRTFSDTSFHALSGALRLFVTARNWGITSSQAASEQI